MTRKYSDDELDRIIDAAFVFALQEEEEELLVEDDADEREPQFSDGFQGRMQEMIDRETTPMVRRVTLKKLARVAVAFLVVVFALSLSVDASRQRLLSTLMFVGEEYFNLNFQELDDEQLYISDDESIPREPRMLPEGYSKTETYRHVIMYSDADGQRLVYSVFPLDGSSPSFDSEGYDIEKTSIAGMDAYLARALTEDKENYIVWRDQHYLYHLVGFLEMEQLIDMAKSVG